MENKETNKGRIRISDQLYTAYWDTVSGLFKIFRPTHIEFRHWENDTWHIWGESKFFEPTIEGQEIPLYSITMTQHGDGNITYKFDKEWT